MIKYQVELSGAVVGLIARQRPVGLTVKASLEKCLLRARLSYAQLHRNSYITPVTIYNRHILPGPPFSLLTLIRILL